MARAKPNRRILATSINTAVATAAVTATAVGWVAFAMADSNSATAAPSNSPSSQQSVSQPTDPSGGPAFFSQQQPSADQLPHPLRNHHHHNDHGGFFGGMFGQSDSQSRQPITRSRSSR